MFSRNCEITLDAFKVKQNHQNRFLNCLDGSRHVSFSSNDQKFIPEPGYDDGPQPTTRDFLESVNDEPLEFKVLGDKVNSDQRVLPYLDKYAQTRGVLPLGHYQSDLDDANFDLEEFKKQATAEQVQQKIYEELSRSVHCGYTSAVYQSEDDDQDIYYHIMDCRKHWCPICGGNGGKIHQHRKKAIFQRVDLTKYNIRQFVLTIPENIRSSFMSRYGMNQLFKAANRLMKKYFGKDAAMIAYIHLFGDEKEDKSGNQLKFHPHVNVHIFEETYIKLKLDQETLEKIKVSWMKALKGMGHDVEIIDIQYLFKLKIREKRHAVKYMSRPTWGKEQIEEAKQEIRELLILGLKGFQYLRFWGALSNCKYEESAMMSKEEKEKIEKELGVKLRIIRFELIDAKKMVKNGQIKEIRPGFYHEIRKEKEGHGR